MSVFADSFCYSVPSAPVAADGFGYFRRRVGEPLLPPDPNQFAPSPSVPYRCPPSSFQRIGGYSPAAPNWVSASSGAYDGCTMYPVRNSWHLDPFSVEPILWETPRIIPKPAIPPIDDDTNRPASYPALPSCTKALLVAINYRNQGEGRELFGCINDVRCLARFLEDQGWARDHIVILDENQPYDFQPTKANILRMIEWLMEDVRSGDALFFGFSGHGGRTTMSDGREVPALQSLDGNFLTSKDLFGLFVERLPRGAMLTAVTDCCSKTGAVLELPYQMRTGQRPKGPAAGTAALQSGLVVCFSGVHVIDYEEDEPRVAFNGGFCTNALLSTISHLDSSCTWGEVLREMTKVASGRDPCYVPILSTTHPLRPMETCCLTPHRENSIRPIPRLHQKCDLNPYINAIRIDEHATEVRAQKLARKIAGEVIMISGCRDDQYSADASGAASVFGLHGVVPHSADESGGACTHALLAVLNRTSTEDLSWVALLEEMRVALSTEDFEQVPQLSSSRPIDLKAKFQLYRPGGGRHRALVVGINYFGQRGELGGCINDALAMKQFLGTHGFNEFRLLVDDPDLSPIRPTKANILEGFRWLLDGAQSGDSLFFHYSGHGGHQADTSGDEADGEDEMLIPVDWRTAGNIVDDDILTDLVMRVPFGCQLSCLIDCCHSGTILDLPYSFVATKAHVAETSTGNAQTLANPKL